MGDSRAARIWLGRLIFAACGGALIFISLIPLRFNPQLVPRPDLLLALTFAFALRRPEFVPIWLLAGGFLMADILMLRPLGLWTAIVILAVEFSRMQEYRFRELVFPFEWAFVAAVMILALLANRLVLALSMVPQPGFGSVMLHYLTTVLAYPLVVFVCYYILRVQKITPDQAIRFGYRL
jgi:rod shape-determining protein MreD